MQFKGTPAPWIKRVTPKGAIIVAIPKKYGERVVETILHIGKIYDDDCGVETCCKIEEHSNARLIAVAPELLNVLQDLWVRSTNLFKELSVEEVEADDCLKALSASIDNAKAIIAKVILPLK